MSKEARDADRNERERAARDAMDQLIGTVAALEKASVALGRAEEAALQQRVLTLLAGAERLQGDVAEAVGNLVRERVIEEYTRRPESKPRPKLSVA